MKKAENKSLRALADRGKEALQSLAVQFVAQLLSEANQGKALDKIVSAFARNQASLISGLLGSAGVAGGAWAAVSLWTSSLGLWSSLGYAIGWVSLPFWIPLAGGAAGLTAAGGAIYSVLHLAKGRQQRHRLRAIIGFSKMLAGREDMEGSDVNVLRRFLRAQDVDEAEIAPLLETTPQQAQRLANRYLSVDARREIARYIFPLVYQQQGVIGGGERRRFNKVCQSLNLGDGAARQISQAYRQRLDGQWIYMAELVALLNYFAGALGFDGREMEIVREELHQLMRFDPRRGAADKRQRLLEALGKTSSADNSPPTAPISEAALMGAYAMAHTAAPEREDIAPLVEAFSALLEQGHSEAKERKKMQRSRAKIDELYRLTRRQIARMKTGESGAKN